MVVYNNQVLQSLPVITVWTKLIVYPDGGGKQQEVRTFYGKDLREQAINAARDYHGTKCIEITEKVLI